MTNDERMQDGFEDENKRALFNAKGLDKREDGSYCNPTIHSKLLVWQRCWQASRKAALMEVAAFIETHAVSNIKRVTKVLPSTGTEVLANAIRALIGGDK